jgi:hypothetical protein
MSRSVAGSLRWFVWGVASAAFALALAYFTNYIDTSLSNANIRTWEHPYLEEGPQTKLWRCISNIVHVATVIAGLSSLGFFIYGMLAVYGSIKRLS